MMEQTCQRFCDFVSAKPAGTIFDATDVSLTLGKAFANIFIKFDILIALQTFRHGKFSEMCI